MYVTYLIRVRCMWSFENVPDLRSRKEDGPLLLVRN